MIICIIRVNLIQNTGHIVIHICIYSQFKSVITAVPAVRDDQLRCLVIIDMQQCALDRRLIRIEFIQDIGICFDKARLLVSGTLGGSFGLRRESRHLRGLGLCFFRLFNFFFQTSSKLIEIVLDRRSERTGGCEEYYTERDDDRQDRHELLHFPVFQ